jgi:hypothetical protein
MHTAAAVMRYRGLHVSHAVDPRRQPKDTMQVSPCTGLIGAITLRLKIDSAPDPGQQRKCFQAVLCRLAAPHELSETGRGHRACYERRVFDQQLPGF